MYGKIKDGNGGRESILKSEGWDGICKTPVFVAELVGKSGKEVGKSRV